MIKSDSSPDQSRNATVLGAGIVGVSCALHLQKRGWTVTLIDRKSPGNETSYGNAGVIAQSALVPTNMPSLWCNLYAYARGSSPSVKYDLDHLAKNSGWMVRYLAGATPRRAAKRAAAFAPIVRASIEDHKALIQEAGVAHRLRDTGWFKLYRTQRGFERAAAERELLAEHGVAFDELDQDGIHQIEPDLKPIFERGCLIRCASSVDNPGKVTAAFATLFERRGGHIILAQVERITPNNSGFTVTTSGASTSPEKINTAHVVVALGPWSMDILAPLGYSIPLGIERGYHCHYRVEGGASLTRPCLDIEAGYAVIPMEQGYRITTGVELAARDAPPSPTQLEKVVPLARQAFALGHAISDDIWLGRRPSTPDSLPIIGQSPKHERLWFAFGHGHNGFGLGPSTGRALAALMSDGTSSIDISGLDAARFS